MLFTPFGSPVKKRLTVCYLEESNTPAKKSKKGWCMTKYVKKFTLWYFNRNQFYQWDLHAD